MLDWCGSAFIDGDQEDWFVGPSRRLSSGSSIANFRGLWSSRGTLMCEFEARELCGPQNSLYLIIKFSDRDCFGDAVKKQGLSENFRKLQGFYSS